MLAQVLFNGISIGCIFGIVGFTFTVIYNASRVINFAQGDFLLVGVWVASTFLVSVRAPTFITICLVVVISGLVGLAMSRFVVGHLFQRETPVLTIIIATMGAAMMMTGTVGGVTKYDWIPVPAVFGQKTWHLFNIPIGSQETLIIVITAILVSGYHLILTKTTIGRALRATAYNKDMATLVGIQPLRMVDFAFVLSAAMAGLAGYMVGPISAPYALMGFPYAIKGFIAAVLGGLGNPYGALIGGIFLGIVTTFATGYISSAAAEILSFVLLLAVLIVRPRGLLGERE